MHFASQAKEFLPVSGKIIDRAAFGHWNVARSSIT
jgi:hypothetical protein